MAVQTRAPARRIQPIAPSTPPRPTQPSGGKGRSSMWGARLRDPRVVLAVACAVLFASVGGFLVKDRTVDVSGAVVDSRTKEPIKGAQVNAVNINERTDGKGRFTVLDVERGMKLRVSADNYRHADIEANGDRMSIPLRPIPVTGRITSSFTGKPIGASVAAGAVRQRTKSDGTFTMYGVGPGDTITVAAFGHRPQKVKVGDGRSVKAALELGRIDPARMLKPIPGYGSTAAPAGLVAAMRAEPGFIPITPEHITGVTVRSITKDGKGIGIVIATAVDPSWAAFAGTQDLFLDAFSYGASKHKDLRIGGIKVRYVQEEGGAGYAWQRFAGFVMVLADTSADAKAITESLIGGRTAIPFDSI